MKRWTDKELLLLTTKYSEIGPKELSSILNRTVKSISAKAIQVGLSRGVEAGNRNRRNKWEFTNWSYDLGYIVGVYLGDGNIYTTSRNSSYFRLSVIDKDFCMAVSTKIIKTTGHKATLHFNKTKNQWILTFSNRDFVAWLRKTFGGPKKKRIPILPDIEANKGMVEGLFDSEGTVSKYNFRIRMQDEMKSLKWILFNQLKIKTGPLNKGGHKTKQNDLHSINISNREYTRVGLGTYIKRKAKNNIIYKGG
jgi:hypothetical protein